MSIKYGPKITTNGLVSLFDAKNPDNLVTPYSEWKMRSFSGETDNEFTTDPNIYDSSLRKFILDGVSETGNIPKNSDTEWKWGSTISINCKASPASDIFNSVNSLRLYYTANNKIMLMTSPTSHTRRPYNAMGIDSSNRITLLGNFTNNGEQLLELDVSGNILGGKRDAGPSTFCYAYAFGKIVKQDNYQWVQTFRGYTKVTPNFLETDTKNYISNSTYINAYRGDMDVDDDYLYITAYYYEHKAFKVPIADYSLTTSFGTGSVTSASDGLRSPRGIAIGDQYLFVSDTGNHRIMVLDPSEMTYITHLGVTGVGQNDPSHFNAPYCCDVHNEKLYISDTGNSKIKIFDASTLEYIEEFSVSSPWVVSVNDDYIATTNTSNGTTFSLYDVSTKSQIFTKTFIYATYGEYSSYGAKAMRRDNYTNEVIFVDRNRYTFHIDPSDDSVTYVGQHGFQDANDLAIDSSYYYMSRYQYGGIGKADKFTRALVVSDLSIGSGDDEYGIATRGVAVNDDYLYIADTTNSRVKIVDKNDLSYVNQYPVATAYSLEIDSSKLYATAYWEKIIYIYDIDGSALTFSDSFSCTVNPYGIRIYDDEIYVWLYRDYEVYDISTHELKRSISYDGGYSFPKTDISYSCDLWNDKLYYLSAYSLKLIDKDTLVMELPIEGMYRYNIIDTPVDDNLFIDVVFTDDYKIKIYANGLESNEYTLDSTYEFKGGVDKILGSSLRGEYADIEYDWVAFYNRAKTLEEHTSDWNNLKERR